MIEAMRTSVAALFEDFSPSLKRIEKGEWLEYAGRISAMQGKKKVDGFYFASMICKPKDLRFYFFPIYTHIDQFELSVAMKKALKGKSCFHFKELTDGMLQELKGMIEKGVALYKKDGVI